MQRFGQKVLLRQVFHNICIAYIMYNKNTDAWMLQIIKCKSLPKTFYPDNIISHEGHVVNIQPA